MFIQIFALIHCINIAQKRKRDEEDAPSTSPSGDEKRARTETFPLDQAADEFAPLTLTPGSLSKIVGSQTPSPSILLATPPSIATTLETVFDKVTDSLLQGIYIF